MTGVDNLLSFSNEILIENNYQL